MGADRMWEDWPACTQCGRPRQTVCPTCGQAGNCLPLAGYQAAAEPQRNSRIPPVHPDSLQQTDPTPDTDVPQRPQHPLLLCPRCDEAFAPRFYRICPACGCDAGSGLELQSLVSEHASNSVLLAVYGLVAVGGALLLYFWFLFRGA